MTLLQTAQSGVRSQRVRDAYDRLHPVFARWTPSTAFRTVFARSVLEEIRRRIAVSTPVRILEIGCGHGTWAEEIHAQIEHADRHVRYLGVDLSPQRVADGRRRLADRQWADLVVADAERFNPSTPPDLILAIEVLAHVPRSQYGSWLARWRHWLAPGGGFVVIDKERYSKHTLRVRVEQLQHRFLPGFARRTRSYFPKEYRPLVETLAYPGFGELRRLARRTGFSPQPIIRHDLFRALVAHRRD
ncbi:MAG: class I SAM-dependent methyltransferase [Phycisphaerae bacterium]